MLNNEFFEHNDSGQLIKALYQAKKHMLPSFSIRLWSRQLGYKNPSYLSEVIRGTRKLKPTLARKVALNLNLSDKRRKYIELLSLLNNSKSIEEKEFFEKQLKLINRRFKSKNIELDIFQIVSEWQNGAILEMLSLKDFKDDPQFIAKRLNNKITSSSAKMALNRLERAKLISQDQQNNIRRQDQTTIEVNHKIANRAVKNYHKQILDLAKDSIESQSISEKEISSSSLAIKHKDLQKIKDLIQDFQHNILQFAHDSDADDVYQLNVQSFKLTMEQKNEN